MPTLLLAGYFGEGNIGDDAMLAATADALEQRGFKCECLSGNPDETVRNYRLKSYNRKNMKLVKQAIEDCDGLVFPGGSIFQDVTSVASCKYYQQLVSMAKSADKKVLLMGQGVGPVTTYFGKKFTKKAFDLADVVAVRDPASATELKNLGVQKRIHITADPAFLLRPNTEDFDKQDFTLGEKMSTVGIAVRPLPKRKDLPKFYGDFSRLLFQAHFNPMLIEMDRNMDGDLIVEIGKTQGGKVPDMRKLGSAMNVQKRMARMDAIIAMRLHAGLLAATVNVPPLMISYDPKVTAFAKLIDCGPALPIEGLTPQRLFEHFTEWLKGKEEHKRKLAIKVEELSALAYKNIELIEQAFRPTGRT